MQPPLSIFSILLPDGTISTTITYGYDNLYRLTKTTYSSGATFDYTYDATGNRLSQVNAFGTITSTYDIANRLVNVGITPYQWDSNGNLVSDGVSTYAYDAANRLASSTQGANNYTFAYNGLGDRVQQTVNSATTNYALDLNAGLTQVLADGTNTYLYGNGRIGEQQPAGFAYHLPDALGSVRQLTNASGAVTLAKSYEPFGNTLSSTGNGNSVFQFTSEMRDPTGLTFLRARYFATLSSLVGRFVATSIVLKDSGTSIVWTVGNICNNVAVMASTSRQSVCVRPTLMITAPSSARWARTSVKNSFVVSCHGGPTSMIPGSISTP